MTISMIAALTKNRVIGKNNDLPWKLPDDMKFFMETTKGHHVILGRKNYDSIPPKFKPLPNRTNIVVTRQKNFRAPGCTVVDSVEKGLDIARQNKEPEAFIIGGAEIYKLGLPHTDRLYLTEIDASIDGDTYFPAFDQTEWKETSRVHHDKDERHVYSFDFVIYDKIKQRMRQKLNLITLGVHDMKKSTAFFEGLGWKKSSASLEGLSLFQLGGLVLALHPRNELATDAMVDAEGSGFSGITISHNTYSESEVDEVLAKVEKLGATIIKPAQKVYWGGYSGYFKDLDGHLFEVAYNPFWGLNAEGNIELQE